MLTILTMLTMLTMLNILTIRPGASVAPPVPRLRMQMHVHMSTC